MCQLFEGRADLATVHKIIPWLWQAKANTYVGRKTAEGHKRQSHGDTAAKSHTIAGWSESSQEKEEASGSEVK